MSFSLSFSPEFYYAPGEPYDCSNLSLNSQGKPYSLFSAIQVWADEHPEDWAELAREHFALDKPELLMVEGVVQKCRETDTCTDIRVPVEVWIDPEGDYRVLVYDNDTRD